MGVNIKIWPVFRPNSFCGVCDGIKPRRRAAEGNIRDGERLQFSEIPLIKIIDLSTKCLCVGVYERVVYVRLCLSSSVYFEVRFGGVGRPTRYPSKESRKLIDW